MDKSENKTDLNTDEEPNPLWERFFLTSFFAQKWTFNLSVFDGDSINIQITNPVKANTLILDEKMLWFSFTLAQLI